MTDSLTPYPPQPLSQPCTASVQDLLRAFLSGRNEKTIKAYSQDLADFQAFVGAATVDDAARLLLSQGHGPANALALSYRTHLVQRCGEVVSLDVEDVDLQQGTLAVRGKGRTSKQLLSLPEPTKAALEGWLAARGTDSGPLLTNFDRRKPGRRLSGTSLYRMVRRLGQKSGLKVRPHGLRHTAITEACKAAQANGIGLEEVLDFSRHSRKSIAILMVYRDRERNVQGQLASLVAAGV